MENPKPTTTQTHMWVGLRQCVNTKNKQWSGEGHGYVCVCVPWRRERVSHHVLLDVNKETDA